MKNLCPRILSLQTIWRVLAPLLAAGAFLATPFVALGEEEGECPEVALENEDCGSSCVIVFGKVGDSFRYDLAASDSGSARYVRGLNALGEHCVLPKGLTFDSSALTLSGVPERPGFHEFVLLSTEQGVTRERVVLIDIQAPSFSAGGSAYAAYFFGGIR